MAASDAIICNRAAARIGVTEQLEDVEGKTLEQVATGTTSVLATQAYLHYATTRDYVLRAFWWPFAGRRVALALLEDEERSDWEYVYAYPDNALAVRYIVPPGVRNPLPDDLVPHKIEALVDAEGKATGRVILCDQEDAEIFYTLKVANPVVFDPDFESALIFRLASEFALSIVKGEEGQRKWRDMMIAYDAELRHAAARALAEERKDRDPISSFEAARR